MKVGWGAVIVIGDDFWIGLETIIVESCVYLIVFGYLVYGVFLRELYLKISNPRQMLHIDCVFLLNRA